MNWPVRFGSIAVTAALLFALNFVVGTFVNDYIARLVVLCGLYVTLSVSLNLINGITGQFSIGHAGFYMVGAYAALLISRAHYANWQYGPVSWLFLMMIAGGAAAAVFGVIVGLPSLRLKGDYLAIVTLGFGEILRIIAINQPEWGGSTGANIEPKVQYIWMVWLLAVVCIAVCRNLLKTAHGLPFLAVREDEVAAQAMGVNLTKTKVTAFIIGSAFAGCAGALFAHSSGFISPDMFKMELSFLILTMVVVGGTGSITGATVAASVLFMIPELSRLMENFHASLAALTGTAVGLVTFVWLMRGRRERLFKVPALYNKGMGWAVTGASIVLAVIVNYTVKVIPFFANTMYDATQLRMVVLAVTLLVVMLLRPEGMFGYHEFSWDIFKRKQPQEAA